MKLSNFKFVKTTGQGFDRKLHATVDMETTTGFLFWKKTETSTVNICRKVIGFWYFEDSGEFTPGCEVENLARIYAAKHPGVPYL